MATVDYNGEMTPLLVPLRTFCTTFDGSGRIRATKWIALTPFQMLEHMAAMLEEFDCMENNNQLGPVRLGPCSLSSKTLKLPHVDGFLPPHFTTEDRYQVPDCVFLSKLDDYDANCSSQHSPSNVDDAPEMIVMIRPGLSTPSPLVQPWDLSVLIHHDPHGLRYLQIVQSLANHLQNNIDAKMVDLYLSLRRDFEDQVDFVTHHSNTIKTNLRRRMLFKVYHQTICKMNALVDSSRRFEKSKNVECAEMGVHMTRWLIMNWTNPYPEVENLNELATACNTTTQVINNWLINARTRKWRPALQNAFQMRRPVRCLRDDSVKFFWEGGSVTGYEADTLESCALLNLTTGKDDETNQSKKIKY
jgi:Homeobox KN domain